MEVVTVVVGAKDVVVVFGKVVRGVGKKGLKEVVGVREVCGTSTVPTGCVVIGVVEGATVTATVVLVVSNTDVEVVGSSVVVVCVGGEIAGCDVVAGTVNDGAVVELVVGRIVDVVVGTHVVGISVVVEEVVVGNSGWIVVVDTSGGSDVVTSVVVVVFIGLPLNDNSY